MSASLPIRVLLIDDSSDDRLLTVETLEDIAVADYRVDEVASWREGLQRMIAGEHDVVLLDWQLGERDGLSVLREARAAGCRIPVILLTGLGDRELDLAAMEAGASDYLPKAEVSPALLERSIRYAISKAATLARLETRTAELARSNRELEQFASIVGHDLRSPMHAIAAYAELLERRYRGQLDDKADHMIDRLIGGVTRLDLLITDLLTYARVNGPPVQSGTVDLDACLDQVLEDLTPAIARSNARVVRDPLPTVPGNRSLLTQVLQNLVGNALKFRTARTPEIRVTATHLPGGRWEIEVRDNGPGIPPADLDRIFVMFQRGRGVGDTEGTGIGLAVCRKVAERHHGTLSVRSREGIGTAFTLTLPGDAEDSPEVRVRRADGQG